MTDETGVDLSGLHRELDRLKTQLCRCQHQGTCIACRGFEMLREQSQMVAAAASQPVLMQVAQEAAINDLMGQMGNIQEKMSGKLAEDSELQELMMRVIDRVQDDLGGPEAMRKMMESFGLVPGNEEQRGPVPYDDRPKDPPATKPPDDETTTTS